MKLTYGPEDIRAMSTIAQIRKNASMYFRSGSFNAVEMIERLVGEAVLLGAESVQINIKSPWFIVSSEHDWLQGFAGDPFSEIISYPAGGSNSMLEEVLLAAFSKSVFTITNGKLRRIKGEFLSDWKSIVHGHVQRVIAFTD